MSSVNLANVNNATISTVKKAGQMVDSSKQSSLDKDAFLKLLAAQAKEQDPMNPSDSTQQIAQLAQFSSLEQMLNVATEMGKLRTTNTNQAAIQLVGHDVTFKDPATGLDTTGVVKQVSMGENGPTLTIGDKTGIDPAQISQVR
ncbi:MAG: flagellar hook assembly protein FlgD [Myxococcales bacterium]